MPANHQKTNYKSPLTQLVEARVVAGWHSVHHSDPMPAQTQVNPRFLQVFVTASSLEKGGKVVNWLAQVLPLLPDSAENCTSAR